MTELEDRRVEEFIHVCANPCNTGAVEVAIERIQQQALPVPRMHSLRASYTRGGATHISVVRAQSRDVTRAPPRTLECIQCIINI